MRVYMGGAIGQESRGVSRSIAMAVQTALASGREWYLEHRVGEGIVAGAAAEIAMPFAKVTPISPSRFRLEVYHEPACAFAATAGGGGACRCDVVDRLAESLKSQGDEFELGQPEG